jgi:methyl-accepting chemotaxis protein
MQRLLSRFTVRSKIILGFVLVMLTLGIVAVLVVMNNTSLSRAVSSVFNEDLPFEKKIEQTRLKLDESVASISFYLLTREDSHLKAYRSSAKETASLLAALEQEPFFIADDKALDQLKTIKVILKSYLGLSAEIEKMATDQTYNLPALKISTEVLGPLSREIFTQIALMQASEENEELSDERWIIRKLNYQFKDKWLSLTNELRLFLAFRFPVALEQIQAYQGEIESNLQQLEKLRDEEMLTLDEEESLALIKSQTNEYFISMSNALAVHRGQEWRKDTYFFRTRVLPLVNGIESLLDELIQKNSEILDNKTESMLIDLETSSRDVLIIVGLGLVLGLLIAALVTHHILMRLNNTVEAMHDISDGEGNLSTRLDESGRDELSRLAGSFNRFVDKISNIVNQVVQTSTLLSEEAGRMLDVVEHTEKGVESQRQEIDSLSSAISGMNDKVEEIASNSGEAALSSRNAAQQARDGQVVVQKSAAAINTLATEVETAVAAIAQVEQESQDISMVVSVIREVSDQTSLLALNAAIEAARAGEYGRGFAVVADEVRSLSARIQGQTNEIIQRIETLQKASREAAGVMQNGYKTAQDSVALSTEADGALNLITERVESISSTSTNIADATEYQSKVAATTADNISKLTSIAESTSEGAALTIRSANQFRSLSSQLQELVQQFLLDQPEPQRAQEPPTQDERSDYTLPANTDPLFDSA